MRANKKKKSLRSPDKQRRDDLSYNKLALGQRDSSASKFRLTPVTDNFQEAHHAKHAGA